MSRVQLERSAPMPACSDSTNLPLQQTHQTNPLSGLSLLLFEVVSHEPPPLGKKKFILEYNSISFPKTPDLWILLQVGILGLWCQQSECIGSVHLFPDLWKSALADTSSRHHRPSLAPWTCTFAGCYKDNLGYMNRIAVS